jgi:hypothetical protein
VTGLDKFHLSGEFLVGHVLTILYLCLFLKTKDHYMYYLYGGKEKKVFF